MPVDYSFDTINDYVNGMEVSFEEMQALCLGMSVEIEKLRKNKKFIKKQTYEMLP